MASVISLFAPVPARQPALQAAPKLAAAAIAECRQLRCLIGGHEIEEHADDSFNRWCTCSRCGKFLSVA